MVLDAEEDISTAGVATTLEQAHAMIGAVKPDVVLLDHRMPDGDGVAAIPSLQAQRPSLGVVVLTASSADQSCWPRSRPGPRVSCPRPAASTR